MPENNDKNTVKIGNHIFPIGFADSLPPNIIKMGYPFQQVKVATSSSGSGVRYTPQINTQVESPDKYLEFRKYVKEMLDNNCQFISGESGEFADLFIEFLKENNL
jgi:hypothetical protein